MILRDLVGGGGRAKLPSLFAAAVVDGRRLDLTASLGCILNGALGETGDSGEAGASTLSVWELAGRALIAGGGNSKAICSCDSCLVPSCPAISVEEAGVGGRAVRGMFVACVTAQQCDRPQFGPWCQPRRWGVLVRSEVCQLWSWKNETGKSTRPSTATAKVEDAQPQKLRWVLGGLCHGRHERGGR